MIIKVTYNVTDVYMSTSVSPIYIKVSYDGGGGITEVAWGDITGTLSDQTDLQSALDLKVPYIGATTNVNLGEYEIKAGQVTLDTTPTGTAAVGTTRWNDTIGSSETTLKGGNVILKNGVDLVARIVNKVTPNTTLTKAAYQAVRISGAQGQRLAVELAQANNDNNSADTIGLVTETIATNQEGFIMTVGSLEGINTTGSLQSETWADGDVLYLSPTTAGRITNVKPIAPQHLVVIGYVEYAHANNGKIYVKVMNGWELGELHDVNTSGATNGQVLAYNSTSGIWQPTTNGSGTVTSVAISAGTGISVSGSPITSSGTITVTNSAPDQVVSLTGAGTTTTSGTYPNFTITSNDQYTGTVTSVGLTSSTSGVTITGSPVTSSGSLNFEIATASGSATGLLSSTDWTTFNNKQNALTNPITGTGTSGQVAYWSGTNTQTGSNNLFWDSANTRFSIGLNTPISRLFLSTDTSSTTNGDNNAFIIHNNNPSATANNLTELFFSDAGSQGGTANAINLLRRYAGISGFATTFNTLNTGGGLNFVTKATTGSSLTTKLQIRPNGNVLIQDGGTFTDSGQRLQVNGDTLMKGSGNTNSTTALTVQNSDGTIGFRIFNASTQTAAFKTILVNSTANIGVNSLQLTENTIYFVQNGSIFYDVTSGSQANSGGIVLRSGNTLNPTTNNPKDLSIGSTFAPTSGTATYISEQIVPTINQTGGANGITRGLYVNPTLTAAADWRSIEFSNNSGWGIYGVGTASNHLAGKLLLGQTSDSGQRLQVNGDTLLKGSGNTSGTTALTVQNSTPTSILTLDNDGSLVLTKISASGNAINSLRSGTTDRFFRVTAGYRVLISSIDTADGALYVTQGVNNQSTSGNRQLSWFNVTFNPTSGTATHNNILIDSTINQTGGANGITRGLYVNPTLTAAADWRSIEVVSASNANHTLIKLRNATVDVFTVKADSKIGFFNATPVAQPTTGIAEATFVENSGGTAVNVDSTFAGYTLQQIAQALKDFGLLA